MIIIGWRKRDCGRDNSEKKELPFRVQQHLLVVVWIAVFSSVLVQDSFVTDACVQSIGTMSNRFYSMVLQLNQDPDKIETKKKTVYYTALVQSKYRDIEARLQ